MILVRRSIVILILITIGGGIITTGCTSQEQNPRQRAGTTARQLAGNWPNAVTYEIFVQSFYDTDNDGIGDIPGVTAQLDYLKGLGIEALWLMPINPSPSYHKYDVVDYRDIHKDYGNIADFKKLMGEAHDRNIKIVIDLVVNHTGRDHPWFQEAIKNPQSAYRNYYVWANKDSIAQEILKKETHLDSDNITQWHAVAGSDQHYYGFFSEDMPDLNFDNPQVREEIIDIGRYWLEDMGVDGFRLDAARHIFPDDRPEDNIAWWMEFRQAMEKIKPGVFLLGEIYTDAQTAAPYLQGLPALFNFDMARALIDAINTERGGNLLRLQGKIRNIYREIDPEYIDATFTSNHDQNRVASQLGGDKHKMRMAASLLLTLPGSPFIYYGEELGMLGVKPDQYIREPFNWAPDDNNRGETRWLDPKYSTDRSVDPLSQQKEDSASLYHHYKKFITLRNNSPVLTYGQMEPQEVGPPSLSSFLRIHEEDTLWVIHNLSNKTQQVTIPQHLVHISKEHFHHGTYQKTNNNLTISPYSSLILKD